MKCINMKLASQHIIYQLQHPRDRISDELSKFQADDLKNMEDGIQTGVSIMDFPRFSIKFQGNDPRQDERHDQR